MGRPSKLSAEQQMEALSQLKAKRPRAEICAEFGISELTLYRYAKAVALKAVAGEQKPETTPETTPEAA